MEYKAHYTQEDLQQLIAWIDTKPTGRLDLGGGIIIDDLLTFTQNARYTVATQGHTPTFSGLVETLFSAKAALEATA